LILPILLIPVYLGIGIAVSSHLAKILGVWEFYIGAAILPPAGLMSAWIIASSDKTVVVALVYVLGMAIAYVVAYPAFYPESHELAYMPTYMPFILTAVWATVIAFLICAYELKSERKL
jgi:hypothetical protein